MIIELRGKRVILDTDVATLYGVETKVVNQAVKNNPDKFPEGYVLIVKPDEKEELVKKFDQFNNLRSKILTAKINPKSRYDPKAFTEKGLYMLATILKSERATATTIAIIEAFARLRELSRTMTEITQSNDKNTQKNLMEKGGEIISEIIGEDLETTGTETEFELNFAIMKLKHKVKRNR